MSNFNLLDGLPGFRDYYPELWQQISFILETMRKVCKQFNYYEYEGPSLEPIELFEAKSGEGLMGEVFHVTDINGRHLVLRPEQTPTLARMLAREQQRYSKPIRWFSIPRLFRDETPQKGRVREFWQLNVDILGEDSVLADAEVIALGINIIRECGLQDSDFTVYINDREFLTELIKTYGYENKAIEIIQAIDRKMKFIQQYIEQDLSDRGKEEDATTKAMLFRRILTAAGTFKEKLIDEMPKDLKPYLDEIDNIEKQVMVKELEKIGLTTEHAEKIYMSTSFSVPAKKFSKKISKAELPTNVKEKLTRLQQLIQALDAMEVLEPVTIDFGLARGLDYYTGIVFEAFDSTGEVVRAILGGGRYEDLVSAIGGAPLTGVGFGMGETVIMEMLKSRNRLPSLEPKPIDIYIAPIKEEQVPIALKVASRIRKTYQVACNPFGWKLKKHLEVSDQLGAKFAILIGPKDQAEHMLSIRDMNTKETIQIKNEELETYLEKLFPST